MQLEMSGDVNPDQEIIDAIKQRHPEQDDQDIVNTVRDIRSQHPDLPAGQIVQVVDEFSNENRKKLVDNVQQSGSPIAAGLAGFGASLQGRSASDTFDSTQKAAQAPAMRALEQFDIGKKASRDDYTFNEQKRKNEQDTEMFGLNKERSNFDLQQAKTKAGRETEAYDSEQSLDSPKAIQANLILKSVLSNKVKEAEIAGDRETAAQLRSQIQGLQPLSVKDAMSQYDSIKNLDYKDVIANLAVDKRIAADKQMKEMEIAGRLAEKNKELGIKGTEGQKEVDKEFAKEYSKYISTGRNNAIASIQKLEKIADDLEMGRVSGGGPIRGALPDYMLRSQHSINARDGAITAANATLREIFGATMTDADRVAAANEYWNDKLDAKGNSKILRDKIATLKQNMKAKDQQAVQYEKTGSIRGSAAEIGKRDQVSKGPQIKVTDGKRVLMIDPEDEAQAAKNGFMRAN